MEYVIKLIGVPETSLKHGLAPLGNFARHIHDHFIPNHRNNYHPHILGHRSLALMSGLLVALRIFTLTTLSLGPVSPAFSSAITPENIISLTNESRKSYGLSQLRQNQKLAQAAQTKADDMLARAYFSHNTPDGKTPWTFIASAGYSYLVAGENLAVNYTEAENVEDAWMNSPGHKANILNKSFEEIGIGIAQGIYEGHNAIFVVQMFGTSAEQKVALSEETTKVSQESVPSPKPVKVASASMTAPLTNPATEPKALGANEQAKETTPALSVKSGEVKVVGQDAQISAVVEGPAVKVLAYFGEQAVMLEAKEGGIWTGTVPLSSVAVAGASVNIKAVGMEGQESKIQLADFSAGTVQNFNLAGTTPKHSVNFFGRSFDLKDMEGRFYLLFIAGILSSLVLAIAIKRHIQHVMLVANSSFVAILAMFLWWVG